jgi:hypothetical protein
VTAPTPFLTGRPNTLLLGSNIFSSGTIGLAISSQQSTLVEYGLDVLSEQYTIAE